VKYAYQAACIIHKLIMNFTTHVGGHVKDHCLLIGFKKIKIRVTAQILTSMEFLKFLEERK
jgi:hypothetical protein